MKKLAAVFAFAAVALLWRWSPARASERFLSEFGALYSSSTSDNAASCSLCHGDSTSLFNAYGKAWAEARRSGFANTAAFRAIESANSDNDPTGASNLVEINAGAQPGWTPGPNNTLYNRSTLAVVATGQNPPFINGPLDPAAAPTNRPPVLNPIGSKTVNEGQTLAFTATATDPDGDALTFAGGNLPAGAAITANGNFSWTPTFAQSGNYSVTITVTDNGTPAQNDSESFTITVGNINRPPVLDPIGNKVASEGQLLPFTATASDPDGGTLTFSAGNLPAGATLNANGVFNWTPSYLQAGNYSVTITVTDGALTASETFIISVGNVNRPPVLSPSPVGSRTVTIGQTLTIAFTASDPDGGALSFTSANLPAGATLVPSGNAATISWTPAAGQAGNYQNVTVTVSDGALTDAEVFAVTVQEPAPTGSGFVRFDEAEWERGRLKAHGRVQPAPQTVTVIDAASGETLGTVATAGEGEWQAVLDLKFRSGPCTVQAKAGSLLSAVVAVKGAHKSCQGGGKPRDEKEDNEEEEKEDKDKDKDK